MHNYVLKTFFIFTVAFIAVFAGSLTTTYLGNKQIKNQPVKDSSLFKMQPVLLNLPRLNPGFNHLVNVELAVVDSKSKNTHIVNAKFDGHNIFLKNPAFPGSEGFRHFQLKPGEYKLKWTIVNLNEKSALPKILKRKILINSNDLWINIRLKGEKIKIS